jgi:serine/threonine protein phosphatase PrpC
MSRLKTVLGWEFRIANPDWDNLFKNVNPTFRDALQSAKHKCDIESLETVQDFSNKEDGVSYVSIKNTRKSYYREDAAFTFVSPSKKTKIGGVFDGHGFPAGYGLYAAVIGAELCKYGCSILNCDGWVSEDDIRSKMNTFFETLDGMINLSLSHLFHAKIDTHPDAGVIYNSSGNLILGGTTCTIVISHIHQDNNKPITVISYVGDSDAYALKSGGLEKITKIEHTPVMDVLPLKNGAIANPSNPTYLMRKFAAPAHTTSEYASMQKETWGPVSLGVQMTRSLGDFFVPHSIEPTTVILEGLYCIIIASDGVWDLKDDKKYGFVEHFNNAVYTSRFDSAEIIGKLNIYVQHLMTNPANKYDDMTLLTIGDILPHLVKEITIEGLLAMDPSELSKKLLEFRLYSINSVAPAAVAPAAAVASSPNQNPFAGLAGPNQNPFAGLARPKQNPFAGLAGPNQNPFGATAAAAPSAAAAASFQNHSPFAAANAAAAPLPKSGMTKQDAIIKKYITSDTYLLDHRRRLKGNSIQVIKNIKEEIERRGSKDDMTLEEIELFMKHKIQGLRNPTTSAVLNEPRREILTNPSDPDTVWGGNRRKTRNRKNHKARTATKSHKIRHNKTRTKSRR